MRGVLLLLVWPAVQQKDLTRVGAAEISSIKFGFWTKKTGCVLDRLPNYLEVGRGTCLVASRQDIISVVGKQGSSKCVI